MNFNKKLAAAVSGAVLLMAGQIALADSTTDIVDALVSKGVLTEEEGKLITKGAKSQKEATDKANKSRIKVGAFVDNATLYGDIRVRGEHREGNGEKSSAGTQTGTRTDAERDRARYKITFGAKTESGDWYGDLAFAMAGAGRTDNATFGSYSKSTAPNTASNLNNKEVLFVKRAMVGYKATDWLRLEAGRMENPFYTTPMVWDADLTFEGLAEKVNFKAGDADIFLTAGQMSYLGDHLTYNNVTSTATTELFEFQAGLKYAFNANTSAKGAVGFTHITKGTTATKYTPGTGTDGAGNAAADGWNSSNVWTKNNTAAASGFSIAAMGVNDLDTIEIPAEINYMASSNIGVRLYGDYVYNTSADDRAKGSGLTDAANGSSGSDDTAWLLGIVVGSGKDLKAFEGNKLAKGDWQARLWYQDVGVWAVDPNAVDSDYMDSRVNMKGTVFKAQYNIEDNVYANFAYGHATRKNSAYGAAGVSGLDLSALNLRSYDLLQLDLTYKF